jgi:hypothetical protein
LENSHDKFSKEPSFKETGLDSPITEFALAMMVLKDEYCYASGTAALIGPRLAITAKHVFDDYWDNLEEPEIQDSNSDASVVYRSGHFTIYVSQFLYKYKELIIWTVKRAWSSPCTDITLLSLNPANQNAVDYQYSRRLSLNLIPPEVGSRVVGFGYHSPKVGIKDGKLDWKTVPTTAVGEVTEVHHEFRDKVKINFPCFRTGL